MTDIREGMFPVLAGQDLTGKEGYLVKMTHDAGVPEVALPSANGDLALYAVVTGGEDGGLVDVEPLVPGKTVRLKLSGACNPGDVMVLADTAAAADCGKVRALPAAAGTYRALAVAEEKGAAGQEVLCRPAMIGVITVVE